jgi:hypothetical protein
VEAAFDLAGILRAIRKAELDSGGALEIVKALKERELIDIGAVPSGLPANKSAAYKNSILNVGLIPLAGPTRRA